MTRFQELLSGGDLRSIGNSNLIVSEIRNQTDFDELFECFFNNDRIVVMRAADAIEKITLQHPSYLIQHKNALLELCRAAKHKELKWHLALLLPRLHLSAKEIVIAWQILSCWASDKTESKIVRVNSLQALYEIVATEKKFTERFEALTSRMKQESIPSINARIKKLKFPN